MGERQISHERAPTLKRRVGKVLRGIEVIEISVGVLLLTTILFMVMAQVIVRFTPLRWLGVDRGAGQVLSGMADVRGRWLPHGA